MSKLMPIYSILIKNAPCFKSNFKWISVNKNKAISGIVGGYNLNELCKLPSNSAKTER